jgi:chromosome segregation ATPase
MSFGLEALFEERLEVFPAEPSSILHPAGHADAVIMALIKERDDLQAKLEDHVKTIDQLERRIYSKIAPDALLPADVVRRLHRLETESHNLRKENATIKDNLRAAESETATLRDTITEQAQKAKGASKKTKNAKEVAGKVEEKAKDAVNDKQRRLASERKMRKERNDALAALSEQEKTTEDLRGELAKEQSGKPYLRDTEGPKSNITTLVVPMEFKIRRLDHMKTLTRLRSRQKYFISMAQQWHETWIAMERENDEDGEESEGEYVEDYMEDEEQDMLYGDMVEGGDMMTGAEHDGWRSMRGLEAACRNVEDRYNV